MLMKLYMAHILVQVLLYTCLFIISVTRSRHIFRQSSRVCKIAGSVLRGANPELKYKLLL